MAPKNDETASPDFAASAQLLDTSFHNQRTVYNQIGSPLPRLPAELRNYVYSLALETATFVVGDDHSVSRRLQRRNLHLPRECRQISHEIRPFLRMFPVFFMLAGQLYHQRPNRLKGALVDRVLNRVAIRESRLCPVITDKTIMDITKTSIGVMSSIGCIFSQRFKLLDRIVLGGFECCRQPTEAMDIGDFQVVSSKSGLEVVYADHDWGIYRKELRYIRTITTAEGLKKKL
ncbi:hypothetical protein E8E11_001470 [Didymella keratinophila]|nr:hypothetical protein E8E11_001470 [Didymella keratinophila]